MTETWLPVRDYEGVYEVSDEGRVRSLARVDSRGRAVNERILKPMVTDGKASVALHVNAVRDRRYVHHVVLEAFVGTCPEGRECCHDNDIGTDNRLTNLRWDTRSANQIDRIKNGRNSNSRKTKCRNGHEFTPDNTEHRKDGSRRCRKCSRQSNAKYRMIKGDK